MFTNLGNIAIPDTATSVTLSNPVKTLVLRVIPELWDGVPFMRLSIQHCADTVMAEQRPILPIQIQHSSVKKNLEDQIKNRLKSKISKVMKKVKQMEQRIGHHKGHGVKDRKKAGKHKSSSERNRVNHRKNKSRRKHITQQNTRQKKPIIKTQHQKRSEVEKKSLDTYDIDGRFGRGDYFGDFGYKYRRGQRDALKRKNSKKKVVHQRKKSKSSGKKKKSRAQKHKTAQHKIKNESGKEKKKQSKAKNRKMAQKKSKVKKKLQPNTNKHRKTQQNSKTKGGQKTQQTRKSKTRNHTKSSGKKSHKLVKNKKRKQKTLQSAKAQRSRQQRIEAKTLSSLTKNIKKTENNLSTLKKQLHTVNQKTSKSKSLVKGKKSKGQVSHKGGTQARGRKPTNSKPVVQGQHSSKGKTPARKPYTPDITPSKNVKTKTESIAPAKTASSQKLVEMQRLEKENTALSESVCKLLGVNLLFNLLFVSSVYGKSMLFCSKEFYFIISLNSKTLLLNNFL